MGVYMIEDYQLGLASGATLSGPGLSPQNGSGSYNLATGEYITFIVANICTTKWTVRQLKYCKKHKWCKNKNKK